MVVIPQDRLVVEQDSTTAIRLQTVLVRVDDDRVCLGDCAKVPCRLEVELVGDDREEPAVRGVDVHPCTVSARERHDVGERVDGAEPRRAESRDDDADAPGRELALKRVEAHAPVGFSGD